MSSQEPESSGPPLRALAMVLISLAILFAAIGVISLAGEGDSPTVATAAAASNSAASTTPPAADNATTVPSATADPSSTADQSSFPVTVYNNSQTQGLAAKTASALQAKGWTIADTTNYSDEVIPQTTVYYGTDAGEQAAATTIASELGVSAAPRTAGLADKPSGIIVVVTQ